MSKPIDILPISLSPQLKQFMDMMDESKRHFEQQFEELILKPVRENDAFLKIKNK